MRSRPTSTTPDDRARDLRTAAAGFAAHLSSSPGVVLPPRHRLAVASLARGALLDYGGDGLGACPLGGMYGHVAGLGSRAGGTWDGPAGGAGECLATIVRSMVNFQGGLDARWYEDAVDAIRTSGVLSDYAEANRCADDGREMDLASRAAFCEVALLASVSHGIHAAFLALGEKVPPLPTPEEMGRAPGPMNLRYSSLLRRVRRDDAVAAAPFFLGRDIDRSSPECSKVDTSIWKGMNFNAGTDMPWVCAGFSPYDADFLIRRFLAVYYLSTGEMMLRWDRLDATGRHCPNVSRLDVETVAAAVADAHSCGF